MGNARRTGRGCSVIYLSLKLLHLLGAAVLFGTGLGSIFHDLAFFQTESAGTAEGSRPI